VVQSGGVGVALLEHIARLGIGVSSFASVGDKYDVSSNDLLTWWEQDGRTRMAVLYVESFGNPRGFARTARRLARQLPVLTVIGGRSPAGQRAAALQPAASAAPLVTQEALFGQAGIVACHSLGELVAAAALLSCQPLPEGRRVGIVSSASGVGVLAADACVDAGLSVAELSEVTQRRLAELLPPGAAVTGPVDTTASVTVADFRACLEGVAADEAVDALLAIGVPTAIADLSAAILAAELAKPVAAVLLDRPDSVSVLSASAKRRVPAYGYPETAARALGHAADYWAWRGQEHGEVPEPSDIDPAAARALVSTFLHSQPGGGWLPSADAARLAGSYGIPLVAERPASGDVVLNASVVQEPVFGPLVVFGLGGIAAEVLSDRAARLAPLTDVDAGQLIRGLQAAPLLLGQRGQPAVDIAGLTGLLLRVSRLADDLPEVADLDLSPVIARPDGVHALNVRVRLARATPRDPFLRQLR
jgi:acyl-CoA synthetase (NDP forming)